MCAASGVSHDPVCPPPIDHSVALTLCYAAHMRLCTLEELAENVAKNSGCGLNSERVWAAGHCADDRYAPSRGGSDEAQDPDLEAKCVLKTSSLPVRCCADYYDDHPAQASGACIVSQDCGEDFYCYSNKCYKLMLDDTYAPSPYPTDPTTSRPTTRPTTSPTSASPTSKPTIGPPVVPEGGSAALLPSPTGDDAKLCPRGSVFLSGAQGNPIFGTQLNECGQGCVPSEFVEVATSVGSSTLACTELGYDKFDGVDINVNVVEVFAIAVAYYYRGPYPPRFTHKTPSPTATLTLGPSMAPTMTVRNGCAPGEALCSPALNGPCTVGDCVPAIESAQSIKLEMVFPGALPNEGQQGMLARLFCVQAARATNSPASAVTCNPALADTGNDSKLTFTAMLTGSAASRALDEATLQELQEKFEESYQNLRSSQSGVELTLTTAAPVVISVNPELFR